MNETKYRIGDVANLIGMSRDTLRHYEKLGILSSQRGSSGYRYYTSQDVSRLISIYYQRKMDLGLGDIAVLSKTQNAEVLYLEAMERQLEREKAKILRHQQNIARIHMTQADYQEILAHLNQVTEQPLFPARLIEPHVPFQEAAVLWFRCASQYPGMDMMYVLDEFSWNGSQGSLTIQWTDTSLILKEECVPYVEYPEMDQTVPLSPPSQCLTLLVRSQNRAPSIQHLQLLLGEAKKRGLSPSPSLFSTFTGQSTNQEAPLYYLQICLPLLSGRTQA